ncbi:MAG: hypothetical protein IPG50_06245, partial [Myxococcales bacterium]|nr:hypothetical protein [Myxococcales bacterium]
PDRERLYRTLREHPRLAHLPPPPATLTLRTWLVFMAETVAASMLHWIGKPLLLWWAGLLVLWALVEVLTPILYRFLL